MTVKQLISKLKRYPENYSVQLIDDQNPISQYIDFYVSKHPPTDLAWEAKHNGAYPDDKQTVYLRYN